MFAAPSSTLATTCVVPDNGGGTANLPPSAPSAGCASGYVNVGGVLNIIDGLPIGTTVDIGAEHTDFSCPGGFAICSFAPPSPGSAIERAARRVARKSVPRPICT